MEFNFEYKEYNKEENTPSGWYITYNNNIISLTTMQKITKLDIKELKCVVTSCNYLSIPYLEYGPSGLSLRDRIAHVRLVYGYTNKEDAEKVYNNLLLLILSKK